jgi:hypothetical protein
MLVKPVITPIIQGEYPPWIAMYIGTVAPNGVGNVSINRTKATTPRIPTFSIIVVDTVSSSSPKASPNTRRIAKITNTFISSKVWEEGDLSIMILAMGEVDRKSAQDYIACEIVIIYMVDYWISIIVSGKAV